MEKSQYSYNNDGGGENFQMAEAYKALRTNVTFCGDDVKVIALTSSLPNEGKTTLSWDMACAMAETGKSVLFMDADLRKSVILGRLKGEQNVKGLSHLLSGQAELSEVIFETNTRNLHAIFAGSCPPNPAELLGNKRFASLVEIMRNKFDYVIIDTPPLGAVIDSAIISTFCDGVILVISSGKVSYKLAKSVMVQLEKANCKILGAVLNKVGEKNQTAYRKGYGKYGDYKN